MTIKYTVALVAVAAGLAALRNFIGGATNAYAGESMNGKTVIVTGANTGIGLETAKQLLKQNATGA
jgi:tRNA-binding EMAP/Myf-like protein